MAFNGPQSTLTNSLFPSYQRQSSVSAGGWSNGNVSVPFGSIPSVSLHNQDTSPYVPWSHNGNDGPYDCINCVQNIKYRNAPQTPDYDGETDLQSLVSNILDEADSQDSFYSEGNPFQCNPIWSPKILQEELLQYFQSEAQTQNDAAFLPNYMSRESFSNIQGQAVDNSYDELYKQSNGPADEFFNFTNGDGGIYTLTPQNPPPGLPVSNMANNYLLQKQRNYDGMAVNKTRDKRELMNNFPDLSDVFAPQPERKSPFIDSHSVDHYTQTVNRLTSEQYMPQDINQLVSSFQSFIAGGEQDATYGGNMHMQTARMQQEDNMAWINTNPSVPKISASTQIQKQLGAEYRSVQRERNGEMRKQAFNCDVRQDLPGFGVENTKYFHPPKPLSVSLYLSNQTQNNMTVNGANMSLPINMNKYSKHPMQQGQMQNKIKPQMQKEKKKMARIFGKHFSTLPLTDNGMVKKEKKQALSQNLYFDFTDGMQTFYGENNMISTKNTRQFTPLASSVNDPRRQSSLPIKSNFSRSTPASEASVSGMDLSGTSCNKPTGHNFSLSDMMSRREENTHHGMESIMTPFRMKRQGGPIYELHLYLNECYEQWRCLEKERRKTEIILSKTFISKWTEDETHPSLLKTPPNSTRLEWLIAHQLREQARVASLLDKLECLCSVHLHTNIYVTLFRHLTAIYIVHARSKKELTHVSQHQQDHANFTEERDTLKLVVALKDLVATTRKLHTALARATQKALPEPKRLEQHVPMENCSSLYDGCSFKL